MTQIFDENGRVFGVTVLKLYENRVTKIDPNKDVFKITISGGEKKRISKAQKSQLTNLKIKSNLCWSKEFLTKNSYHLSDELKTDLFQKDELVKIIGTGKGKGFQGTIKRHGFSRGPMSHGSHHHRKPGSIGSTYPQRVVKGKKMAGHMGNNQVTVKNAKIIDIDIDNNILVVKGSVPGSNKHKILIIKND